MQLVRPQKKASSKKGSGGRVLKVNQENSIPSGRLHWKYGFPGIKVKRKNRTNGGGDSPHTRRGSFLAIQWLDAQTLFYVRNGRRAKEKGKPRKSQKRKA